MTEAESSAAYYALALQLGCRSVTRAAARDDSQPLIDEAIARVDTAVRGARAFAGTDVVLIVLPEYFLTGHPLGESLEEWREKAAIAPGGAEYEALGAIAQKHGVHLAGNAYETDEHFPGLYFQTSFVLDPAGEVALRYRRLISMYAPSPYDVWERYLERYGLEGVFPVADTGLGRLAAIASEEILYPEIARALALRGAEVFLHSSSEVASNELTPKNVAKRARALENLAYVVSANSAGLEGSPILAQSVDFGSKVIDFRGRVLAEAGYGESIAACAEIDLAALRRYRRRPGMGNLLARQPTGLYARAYGEVDVHPEGGLLEEGALHIPERGWFVERQRRVIERLAKDGII